MKQIDIPCRSKTRFKHTDRMKEKGVRFRFNTKPAASLTMTIVFTMDSPNARAMATVSSRVAWFKIFDIQDTPYSFFLKDGLHFHSYLHILRINLT
jgi:hypothetical protein